MDMPILQKGISVIAWHETAEIARMMQSPGTYQFAPSSNIPPSAVSNTASHLVITGHSTLDDEKMTSILAEFLPASNVSIEFFGGERLFSSLRVAFARGCNPNEAATADVKAFAKFAAPLDLHAEMELSAVSQRMCTTTSCGSRGTVCSRPTPNGDKSRQ